jgi:menaquinone-dependent protoporphyrinogen oxidase
VAAGTDEEQHIFDDAVVGPAVSLWSGGGRKAILRDTSPDAEEPVMTVLVAYASRRGTTREVAERIAARLGAHGYRVHLDPLLGREEVRRFGAVVLGSAVYGGRWEDDAVGFVRRNAAALAGRPLWTFSVGWLAHHRGLLRKESWSDAKGLAELDRLLPARDHRFFAGALSPAELPLGQRTAFRLAGGRYGDCRDWAAIHTWTDDIAQQLAEAGQLPAIRTSGLRETADPLW